MGNFSVNQVRQLYVVNSVQGTASKTDGTVTSSASKGTVALRLDADGKNMYFQYKGADNLMRSDLINLSNIMDVQAIASTADSQNTKLKTVTVKLDSSVNGGAPISGQDYILRIVINPYLGMSDEEPYFKYGAVHATGTMTAADFYIKMAASLYKNFSREQTEMLAFVINNKKVCGVKYDENGNEVLIDSNGATIEYGEGDTGLLIGEVEQEWTRGIKEQTSVNFTVIPTTVTYDGEEVKWGTTSTSNSGTVNNGKKIADLEYFCMGERGDQYRNIGWPNVIPTTYLVDPDVAYNILNIHYAYTGPNEGPQKSEKDITIVCSNASTLNKLIGQLNAATGLKVATL
jgi:hypothetical protein